MAAEIRIIARGESAVFLEDHPWGALSLDDVYGRSISMEAGTGDNSILVSTGSYLGNPEPGEPSWQLLLVDGVKQEAHFVLRSARYRAAERMQAFLTEHYIGFLPLEPMFRELGGIIINPGGRNDYDRQNEPTVIGKIYSGKDMIWSSNGTETDLSGLATMIAFLALAYPDGDHWPGRYNVDPDSPHFQAHQIEIETGAAMLLHAAEGVQSDLANKAFAALKKAQGDRDW